MSKGGESGSEQDGPVLSEEEESAVVSTREQARRKSFRASD